MVRVNAFCSGPVCSKNAFFKPYLILAFEIDLDCTFLFLKSTMGLDKSVGSYMIMQCLPSNALKQLYTHMYVHSRMKINLGKSVKCEYQSRYIRPSMQWAEFLLSINNSAKHSLQLFHYSYMMILLLHLEIRKITFEVAHVM